jgi:hypothetical protein
MTMDPTVLMGYRALGAGIGAIQAEGSGSSTLPGVGRARSRAFSSPRPPESCEVFELEVGHRDHQNHVS